MIDVIMRAQNVAQENGVLNLWTVYDHPSDFPHSYVARRFELDQPTGDIIQGELQIIRKSFRICGLYCLKRHPADDPKIIETWL